MRKKGIEVLLLGIIMIISLAFQGCGAFKATANRYVFIPGTYNGYKLIHADWLSVNDVYQSRYGRISNKLVLGFCDHARKEIWYSEGVDDKFFKKLSWYVSNKEHEMKHAMGDDLGERGERLWELRYGKRSQEIEKFMQESYKW